MSKDDDAAKAAHGEHDASHEHSGANGDHEDAHGGHEGDHGEHAEGHADARRSYDPHKIELPGRQPPLRSTAPQSEFATTQVVRGAVVLVIGLVLTFGLGVVLA